MKKNPLVLVVTLAVGVLALVYIPASLWGEGGRGFFSPDNLQTRTQREFVFPLADFVVSRSSFTYYKYDMVNYLERKGYWRPRDTVEPRWICAFRWNNQWRGGATKFHKELSWRAKEWIDWSERHPEIAADFWPKVLDLLRSAKGGDLAKANGLLSVVHLADTRAEYNVLVNSLER